MTGVELIAIERQEQIIKHKRTIENDVIENREGQLIDGAMQLLKELPNDRKKPYMWNKPIWEHMRNKGDIERYAIAGALIAAEIDRLQATE